MRLCIDYRELSKLTRKTAYPLPPVGELLIVWPVQSSSASPTCAAATGRSPSRRRTRVALRLKTRCGQFSSSR